MRAIAHIVVHTAAAANAQGQPVYQTAEDVDRYHREHNGWKRIGYHSFIERDGRERRDICRGDDEVGAHVQGKNEHTLGVCVAGHGDFADFLPAQRRVLVDRCVAWCRIYKLNAAAVVGHRELGSDKTCPGLKVNMAAIRAEVERALVSPTPLSLDERIHAVERYLDRAAPNWRV